MNVKQRKILGVATASLALFACTNEPVAKTFDSGSGDSGSEDSGDHGGRDACGISFPHDGAPPDRSCGCFRPSCPVPLPSVSGELVCDSHQTPLPATCVNGEYICPRCDCVIDGLREGREHRSPQGFTCSVNDAASPDASTPDAASPDASEAGL